MKFTLKDYYGVFIIYYGIYINLHDSNVNSGKYLIFS